MNSWTQRGYNMKWRSILSYLYHFVFDIFPRRHCIFPIPQPNAFPSLPHFLSVICQTQCKQHVGTASCKMNNNTNSNSSKTANIELKTLHSFPTLQYVAIAEPWSVLASSFFLLVSWVERTHVLHKYEGWFPHAKMPCPPCSLPCYVFCVAYCAKCKEFWWSSSSSSQPQLLLFAC